MTTPTLDDLHTTWSDRRQGGMMTEVSEHGRALLDLLADGRPVSPDQVASATGWPREEVVAWLERARQVGYEVDDRGRLVGAALTLRPTPHRFRVRGNDLYTWCGWDALFLPILLREAAHVRSTCPVTSRALELDVAPDGSIADPTPPTLVVAVVGQEVTDSCATTGPASSVCTQMPMIADRAAAEEWLEDHPGVAVVSLDDAVDLAREYTAAC